MLPVITGFLSKNWTVLVLEINYYTLAFNEMRY